MLLMNVPIQLQLIGCKIIFCFNFIKLILLDARFSKHLPKTQFRFQNNFLLYLQTIKEIVFTADEVKQLYNNISSKFMNNWNHSAKRSQIVAGWLRQHTHRLFLILTQLVCNCTNVKKSGRNFPQGSRWKIEGTIVEVVWPSVELKDGTGFYRKGDVIVVKKGIKRKHIQ